MDKDCMFCEKIPCECEAKPAKKTRKIERALPALPTRMEVNPFLEALRMLNFNGMLHPSDIARYRNELAREKPTGKLLDKEA